MSSRKTMIALIVLFTAISAGMACIAGIRSGMDGRTFTFVAIRGETLEFQSEGIYRYNPRWFVAEGIGWDIATLVVGIPALLTSFALFISAGFLLLMWLGKIVPALARGETPEMLRGVNTLIAQALDLGIIVPFTLAAGILLLRRNAWGYLLASVGIVKLIMMALAIIAMVVVRSIVQGAVSWAEIIMFTVLASVGTGFLVALLRSFESPNSDRGA